MAKWDPRKDPSTGTIRNKNGETAIRTKSGQFVDPTSGLYINNYHVTAAPGAPKKTAPTPTRPTPTSGQVAAASGLLTGKNSGLGKLTGGDLQTGADGQTTTRVQRVKQIQQLLRNHGYQVKVDGIAGNQTNSALKDFHSSQPNSKAWNAGHGMGTSSVVDPNKVGSYSPGGSTNPADTVNPSNNPPSNNSGITPADLKAMKDPKGLINAAKYLVDPAAYGQSVGNSQFGSQITAAQQAIKDAQASADMSQTNLGKWFGDASSLAASGAKAVQATDKAAIANQGKAGSALLAAFGGNAGAGGAGIAETAQNGVNSLSDLMASHGAFDNMLGGLISAQGATAKSQQAASDTKSMNDIKATLSGLIAQKAAAIQAATSQGRQQNLQNIISVNGANNATRAAALNQYITQAELPGNIAMSKLKTAKTIADINKSNALAGKDGTPRSFFVNATANDVNSAKAGVIAAIKALPKGFTSQQAIRAAIAAQPWKIGTPGVASRVVIPALTLAGVPGVTAQMLGIQ